MSKPLNSLNHRLVDTVRRELGPDYIRLFAPHFFSHAFPAGLSGLILSCTALLYLLLPFEEVISLPVIFIAAIGLGVLIYSFPFQNMVMGKSNHLKYFKWYGVLCTLIALIGVFVADPISEPNTLLEEYLPFFPVFIGIIFCWLLHSKKFTAMLVYQQKLWAIKARLIAEEKALVAELSQRTKKRAKK